MRSYYTHLRQAFSNWAINCSKILHVGKETSWERRWITGREGVMPSVGSHDDACDLVVFEWFWTGNHRYKPIAMDSHLCEERGEFTRTIKNYPTGFSTCCLCLFLLLCTSSTVWFAPNAIFCTLKAFFLISKLLPSVSVLPHFVTLSVLLIQSPQKIFKHDLSKHERDMSAKWV